MTAGTVVITGGILATVILLCIIAVLCYCRLQVRAGPDGDISCASPGRDVLAPGCGEQPPWDKNTEERGARCPRCRRAGPPTFFLQEPDDEELPNGGERVSYGSDDGLPAPAGAAALQALNPNRLSAMREAFSRSRSISTDV
ncbi:F163B protein, partial [Crypturellus soui]|nr:F163B protein [Crypturellus soui]